MACLPVHVLVLLLLVVAAVRGQDAPPSGQTDGLVEAKKQEISALKAQVKAMESEIARAKQCKDDLVVKKKMITALEAQIEGLKDQVATTQTTTEAHLGTCQEHLDTARRSNTEAKKQNQELEHTKEELLTDLTKARTELSEVHSEKEQLSTKLAELQVQFSALNSSQAVGQDNLKACKGELKKLADGMLEAENQAGIERIHFLKLQQDLRAAILPYWLSQAIDKAMEWMAPYIDMAKSHPVVGEFISSALQYSSTAATWTMENSSTFLKQLLETYVASKPVMEEVGRQTVQLLAATQEWLVTSYIQAKPHVESAAASIQTYVSMAIAGVVSGSKQGWTLLMVKFNEIMASEAVASVKLQGSTTARELRQFIRSQMQAYPALQPYATPQAVDIALYTLLSLPGLAVLSLLSLCCGSSAKLSKIKKLNPGGVDQDNADKSSSDAARFQKKTRKHKGRTITEGTDSVRVPS